MKKEELMKQYEELKGKGKEPEMIFLYIQRQIVKDFLIKFTKKVPEAPYGS